MMDRATEEMFRVSELAFELEDIFDNTPESERDWVLTARVRQNCKLD